MKITLKTRSVIFLLIGTAVVGCASTQPTSYSSLASSARLQANPEDASGKIPYRYSTKVLWKEFKNVIIDPVDIYSGPDHQFGDLPVQDKESLAEYMKLEFGKKLATRFGVIDQPKPNTLRVRLTLTGVETNTPLVSTALRFDLVGGPYNIVQSIRGKEGLAMGSVSYSVEIYEATTNRLLEAYVTKQYPNAMNVKATLGTLGAARAGVENGAEALVAELS